MVLMRLQLTEIELVCITSLHCIKSSPIHEAVASIWYDNCTFVEVDKS